MPVLWVPSRSGLHCRPRDGRCPWSRSRCGGLLSPCSLWSTFSTGPGRVRCASVSVRPALAVPWLWAPMLSSDSGTFRPVSLVSLTPRYACISLQAVAPLSSGRVAFLNPFECFLGTESLVLIPLRLTGVSAVSGLLRGPLYGFYLSNPWLQMCSHICLKSLVGHVPQLAALTRLLFSSFSESLRIS